MSCFLVVTENVLVQANRTAAASCGTRKVVRFSRCRAAMDVVLWVLDRAILGQLTSISCCGYFLDPLFHQDRRVRDAGTGGAGRALALSSPTSLFRQPLRQDQQPTQAHSPAPSNPPLVVFPSSSLWSAMDSCYMGCNVTSCPYIETIEEG